MTRTARTLFILQLYRTHKTSVRTFDVENMYNNNKVAARSRLPPLALNYIFGIMTSAVRARLAVPAAVLLSMPHMRSPPSACSAGVSTEPRVVVARRQRRVRVSRAPALPTYVERSNPDHRLDCRSRTS